MSKSASRGMLVLFPFLVGFACPATAAPEARVSETYGKLPLHFEANRGQTHEDVRFLARGAGYSLYLTADEAVLVLTRPNPDATQPRGRPVVVRMSLVGAAPKPLVSGLDELPGKANYLIGNPAKWQTNVPTYAKVHYREVYPGIDLVYYGNQRQLEYDFVVSPRADPERIVLGFQGAERLEINAEGEFVLHAAGGAIRQRVPVIYQEIDGVRTKIEGRYVLKDAHRVGFQVAAYDPSRPLVIDPTLVYSTYLGGSSSDDGYGIAVDAAGAAYVTGTTGSADFTAGCTAPCTGLNGTLSGRSDVFVTKINAAGTALVYSTYLGGSGYESGNGIAVDAAGAAYVTGTTSSTDFPTTPGAIQTTYGGGGSSSNGGDAFVSKLNAAGSALLYSTYLGGSGDDSGFGIAVDAAGSVYVTGSTTSTDFPTANPLQAAYGGGGTDAFVSKLDAAGSALLYSTYLGGSGWDDGYGIAVDAAGSAYVTGGTTSTDFPTANPLQAAYGGGLRDAFVSKLNAAGSALLYSTYLGGSGWDQGHGIAVDAAGSAYVTGQTNSTNFPTVNPLQAAYGGGYFGDAFVSKLNAAGSALLYSTYLGGSGNDYGSGIAVDAAGSAYVTGYTTSTNFPTASPLQAAKRGGYDAFVTKLNATGTALVYSTYLGGSDFSYGYGIAVDAAGAAYVTGSTIATDFTAGCTAPCTVLNGILDGGKGFFFGWPYDAFVAKIAEPTFHAARADFNGDGRADILWRNSSTGENYLWLMNGTTIVGEGYLAEADLNWQVAGLGDFNGDGTADILWRNSSTGENYVYLMNGTTITGQGHLPEADLNWQVAGVGDFNGDGKADILWRNSSTGQNYLYLMNGTTVTGGSLRTQADQNWQVAGVGDFNGDGRADILWRSSSTGENYLWLMNATTIAGEGSLRTEPDQNWKVAGVGDFNGDGTADILWRYSSTGENYVYLMSGTTITGEGHLAEADLNWQVAGVGDFNGDGKADILWRNSSTGENYVYLMNGTTNTGGSLRTLADLNWQVQNPR